MSNDGDGGGGADGGRGRGGRSTGRGGGGRGSGRGRSGHGRGRGREGGGARGGRGRGGGGGGRGAGRGEQQQQQPSQAGNAVRGGPGRGPNRNNRANGASSNNRNDGPPLMNHAPNTKSRPATTQQQQQQQLSQAPKKKNGEKGADVHTVFEVERIQFTKILMDLREGSQSRLEFPPNLTNTERKFVHQLASQLGLTSKSTGKGDARHIVVTKRNADAIKKATAAESKLPRLQVGRTGRLALEQHWRNYPPTHAELLESRETGSSLVEAFTQAAASVGADDDDDEAGDRAAVQNATLADTLNQLGLGVAQGGSRSVQRRAKPVDLERRRQRHAAAQESKRSNQPDYNQMLQRRAQLPAFRHQEQIVQTVAHHPVTIIQGDTGCGKSTQVPQFLLDANPTANIVVTQPRRISAISIAERVHQEQCLPNEAVGGMIGYQVRLEAAMSAATQLQFVTPGILLRKLQGSSTLQEFTHIVLDEVHERDKYTEFLLIALRDLLPRRPDLRLILMSATIQTDTLIQYFSASGMEAPDQDDAVGKKQVQYYQKHPPAVVEMEGRTFPVQEFFLEHVLQMTGYIDVSTPLEEQVAADVSSQQLEKELSLLLLQQDQRQHQQQQKAVKLLSSLNCVLCGLQGFSNALDLGGHVSICDGGGATNHLSENHNLVVSSGMDGVDNDDDDAGDQIVLPPSDDWEDDKASAKQVSLDDFEDYDEEEEAVLDGFDDFFDGTASNNIQASEPEVTTTKWDGTSPFEIMPANETLLSATEEELLTRYQSMHDDEQVDSFLLLEVFHYIVKSSHGDGAILVFFSGWQDISEFALLLDTTPPFSNKNKFSVLPLHSGIPSRDQRKVLQRPPKGTRKIILSTNIAETSLTIDDVSFVIDTGRQKLKDYDPHLKTSTLQPMWISRASSKQRKGRAGRTKAGVCFHLFSSVRHESMRPFVESELLRTPLEEMCLLAKRLGLAPGGTEDRDGVAAFLGRAMSTPHKKSVANALELLVDMGAMQPETNDLTDLGHCLSILSLEPRVGKMVIWSYLLGCSQVASNMAVAMSYKSPFVLPPPNMRRDAANAMIELSQNSESDQLTVVNAILRRDQLHRRQGEYNVFCRRSFLNGATLEMISELRQNLKRELSSLSFPDPLSAGPNQYHNRHDKDHALWQAAVAAGLYPNIASRRSGEANFSTMSNQKAKIHISSVNAQKGQPLNAKCQVPKDEVEFVCFGELVKGTHFFTMSQTTHLASPLPLLLLCGSSLSVHPDSEDEKFAILNVDDWIVFKADADTASHIAVLRKRLDSAFWRYISKPLAGINALTDMERDALEVLGPVLQSAHKSAAAGR